MQIKTLQSVYFVFNLSKMKKVVKLYKALNKSLQKKVYEGYIDNSLEKTVFPFNGNLVEGVLYTDGNNKYLIPVSSIKEFRKDVYQDLFEDEDMHNVNRFDFENEE